MEDRGILAPMPTHKDRPDNAGVRFPPPLIFLSMILLGLGADRLFGLPSLSLGNLRWISTALLGVAGAYLIVAAMSQFSKAGTRPEPWLSTSAITTAGVYGWTRNPMYLGMTLLHLAIAMAFSSVGAATTALLALIVIDRYVIRREELYLERKFGSSYLQYQSTVRRWL